MNPTGFIALSVVIVLVPGPAVTLVLKQSLLRGRSAALQTAGGVFVADLVWMIASVLGITAVIVASKPVFGAIRLAGALYLAWLGIGLLLDRSARTADEPASTPDSASRRTPSARRLHPFVEGLLCDLSNPKTLLVFTSIIPQFLPVDGAHPIQVAVLGLLFALIGFGSLLLYTITFGGIGIRWLRSRTGDVLLRASGMILLAFGIRLALDPLD